MVVNARTSAAEAEAVADEIRKAGGRAAVKIADITDPDAATALMAAAVESFGRLDILVNNAGVRRETAFAKLGFSEWQEILATILDGAYLCSHAALPHLIASGSGATSTSAGCRRMPLPPGALLADRTLEELLSGRLGGARQPTQLVHVPGDFDEPTAPAHGRLGHHIAGLQGEKLRILRTKRRPDGRVERAGGHRVAAASVTSRHEALFLE